MQLDSELLETVCSHGEVQRHRFETTVCIDGVWASILYDEEVDQRAIATTICRQLMGDIATVGVSHVLYYLCSYA